MCVDTYNFVCRSIQITILISRILSIICGHGCIFSHCLTYLQLLNRYTWANEGSKPQWQTSSQRAQHLPQSGFVHGYGGIEYGLA